MAPTILLGYRNCWWTMQLINQFLGNLIANLITRRAPLIFFKRNTTSLVIFLSISCRFRENLHTSMLSTSLGITIWHFVRNCQPNNAKSTLDSFEKEYTISESVVALDKKINWNVENFPSTTLLFNYHIPFLSFFSFFSSISLFSVYCFFVFFSFFLQLDINHLVVSSKKLQIYKMYS